MHLRVSVSCESGAAPTGLRHTRCCVWATHKNWLPLYLCNWFRKGVMRKAFLYHTIRWLLIGRRQFFSTVSLIFPGEIWLYGNACKILLDLLIWLARKCRFRDSISHLNWWKTCFWSHCSFSSSAQGKFSRIVQFQLKIPNWGIINSIRTGAR